MRSIVPFFSLSLLGAAATARIPRNDDQPSNRLHLLQALREEITRLEHALREDYSRLASLFNSGPSPTRFPFVPNSPGHNLPGGPILSTSSSITTTTLNTEAASVSPTTPLPTSSVATSLISKSTVSTESNSSIGAALSTPGVSATSSLSATSTSLATVNSSTLAAVSTTTSRSASSTLSTTTRTSATATAPAMASVSCADLCSALSFTQSDYPVNPVSCASYAAGSAIPITGGQASAGCGTSFTTSLGICRVVLTVETSDASETYMEVWLPENGEWNGRTMNTDNGGVNGCVHYVDMQYVSSRGFAAIGDNAGHNGSSFDGSWFAGDNEVIIDWVWRARHAAVVAGKEVVSQFYEQDPEYSYYIGCSAGGAQGMKSAQMFPDDFDGIIAGSAASDFNHLQAWSGRFVQLTGISASDAKFLTQANWITVQAAIFDQCDGRLDGVDDGILEDPTLCQFDSSVLSCTNNSTLSGCLTDTQVNTVNEVFTELYNSEGELLYPALNYGSQVDAFRLGQLSGSVQGISRDWYRYAINNDSAWDPLNMDQADYALADSRDAYHGNVSSYSGDLSAFRSAGKKLIMYHGMADPLVSSSNSQRYYLKVAQTLGLTTTEMDDFYRFFRISGMAHCGVGGISGAGAWMFGQNAVASAAPSNIIDALQQWVEADSAPETLVGTKFWYDTPALGVQLERAHCRFPYRTTYVSGDASLAASWGCALIEGWSECGPGARPRLCNVDGSFL